MSRRVRIEDVAAAAGMSMKTVSRVLNGEPNVREDTRAQVMRAVERLKYVPNHSARSLAGNKSYLVALIYNNPSPNYLMEVISGVLAGCQAKRYTMLLGPFEPDGPELVAGVEAMIARSRPDGLILTPPITDSPALLKRLFELKVPYASISPKRKKGGVCVAMDETRAAFEMVVHLASLGHKRIAHIVGPQAHGASAWRLTGYQQGLQHAGLKFDPGLLVQGEFTFDSGVHGAERLLALKRPPTAVFAANDDMAAGVIRVALDRHMRVPEDISICGFDDTPLSNNIFPPLTTVHQPTREMGRLATLALLEEVQNPGSVALMQVPYTLKLRRSTGPAPKRVG